jgi:hypothetical protein
MSTVEAIETNYDGTTYRSRTEARWALLFDLAGIEFQYEPEGYKLHSGWYVPDFKILAWDCFFEVKPENVIIEAGYYNRERSLAEDLAMATESDVLFGLGSPHPLLKLARVPVLGISPVHEWLTDHIPAHHIPYAMKFRFDWAKPAGGDTGPLRPIGEGAWRAAHTWKRNRDDS